MSQLGGYMLDRESVGPTFNTTPEIKSRQTKALETAKWAVPSVVAGFADTLAQPFVPDDAEDTFMKNTLTQMSEEWGDYYENNRDVSRAVGDFVGMFIPGTLGIKMLNKGSTLTKSLLGDTAISRALLTSGKSLDEATTALRAQGLKLAKQAVDPMTDAAFRANRSKLMATRVGDTVKEAVAFEASVLATMNGSDFLYPEDFEMSDHIELALAGIAIPGAVDYLMTKRVLNGVARTYGTELSKNLNKSNLDLNKAVFATGERDIGTTIWAAEQNAQTRAAETATEQASKETLTQAAAQSRKVVQSQIQSMGLDTPIRELDARVSLDRSHIDTLEGALSEDAGALLGVKSLEPVSPRTLEVDSARENLISKKRAELTTELNRKKRNPKKIDEINQQISDLEQSYHFVIERDGGRTLTNERELWFHDMEGKGASIKKFKAGQLERAQITLGPRAPKLTVDGSGVVTKNGKQLRPADQTFLERTAVYRALDELSNNTDTATRSYRVNETTNHDQLDYILQVMDKHADLVKPDMVRAVDGKALTADEIEFMSLSKKFETYQAYRKKLDAKMLKKPVREQLTEDKVARMLNLPAGTHGEGSAVLDVFDSLLAQGDTSLAAGIRNIDHFRRQMQVLADFRVEAPYYASGAAVRGNMMAIDHARSPVMARAKMLPDNAHTTQALQDAANNLRQSQLEKLANSGHDLVDMISNRILKNASFKYAEDVQGLAEGSQRGAGYLTQAHFAAGDNAATAAVEIQRSIVDKEVHKAVRERTTGIIGDSLSKLRGKNNIQHLESFTTAIHARRMGWDLENGFQKLPGSKFSGIRLRDTADNRKRWKMLYGSEMPKGAMMPVAPRVVGKSEAVPAALSLEAQNAMDAISRLDYDTLGATNAIRRAENLSPITPKEHHVPPANLTKGHNIYLVNKDGSLAGIASGRTAKEAENKAAKSIAENPNLIRLSQKDMELNFALRDEAFERMRNYADPLAQTGKAKGTSVTTVIDTGEDVIDDILESVNHNYQSILRRTRSMVYDPQLRYSKMRLGMERNADAVAKGKTVWQQYARAVYGNPQANPNDWTGKVSGTVDDLFNWMLEAAWDKTAPARHANYTANARRTVDELKKQMGEYAPFADAEDYVRRTHKLKSPWNAKATVAKMNQIVTLLSLRLFDVGYAMLNVLSLGATIPAVTNALKRGASETTEEYLARTSAYGMQVADQRMFSPHRMMATVFHEMFQPEWKARWRAAAERGFFKQEVAELMEDFAVGKKGDGMVRGMLDKAGQWVTMLADKSEEFSRAMSYMVGDTLARRAYKMTDEDAIMTFAHRFANDNIGNYSPGNRPRIFNGASGMSVGLFTTFMWNYYQRVFSYIERGDIRALATQYAAQSSVFGASTVPGFDFFTETLAANYSGDLNIVDEMESKLGPNITDTFFYGPFATLPKMFGLEDGLSVYQRGDTNVNRIPGMWAWDQAPAVNVMGGFANAMGRMVGQYKESGLTTNQIAEILSQDVPNRFMKNIFEIYLGYSVDQRGQMINDDTRSQMSLVARTLGVKPFTEQKTRDTMYRMRNIDFSQRAKMVHVRESMRSLLRSGDLTDKKIANALNSYVKHGGNPAYFSRWLKTQAKAALINKNEAELIKAMKDPTRLRDTKRLLNAMSSAYEG